MEKWEMVFYYVKISQLDILILPVWKPVKSFIGGRNS